MGILRLILALNVLIVHCPGSNIWRLTSVGGEIAVQLFFIISGFYMSMILTQKYIGKDSYKLFISNRILKLFPIYLIILFSTIVFSLLAYKAGMPQPVLNYWINNFTELSLISKIIIISSSIFIVGQEIFCFTGLNKIGQLYFSSQFQLQEFQPFRFMFVPQAWTLSLELIFYFFAPYLIKLKSIYILLFIFVSTVTRFLFYSNGYSNDPWSYRFFPFELTFFLVGILSYRLYEKHKDAISNFKFVHLCYIATLAYIILFQYIPLDYCIKKWLLFCAISLILPIIFNYTKHNKIDKFIGELSYPVYISHFLILEVLYVLLPTMPRYLPLLAIIFSIAVSIFLAHYVSSPIEKFRQKRIFFQNEKRNVLESLKQKTNLNKLNKEYNTEII